MAASSHPSHRVQETEREVASRSQARRSRRVGGHTIVTTAVIAMQHQRSAGTVQTPPPVVGIEAT
jgi:hypothetical protein